MNIDPAGELAKLLKGAIQQQINSISVSFICRIISYDSDKGLAVVQPLIRNGEEDSKVILNVPVLGQRYMVGDVEQTFKPVLHPGDAVFVVCADQEIKNVLSGQIATPSTNRIHNLNDAVIVGVLMCSL